MSMSKIAKSLSVRECHKCGGSIKVGETYTSTAVRLNGERKLTRIAEHIKCPTEAVQAEVKKEAGTQKTVWTVKHREGSRKAKAHAIFDEIVPNAEDRKAARKLVVAKIVTELGIKESSANGWTYTWSRDLK